VRRGGPGTALRPKKLSDHVLFNKPISNAPHLVPSTCLEIPNLFYNSCWVPLSVNLTPSVFAVLCFFSAPPAIGIRDPGEPDIFCFSCSCHLFSLVRPQFSNSLALLSRLVLSARPPAQNFRSAVCETPRLAGPAFFWSHLLLSVAMLSHGAGAPSPSIAPWIRSVLSFSILSLFGRLAAFFR